MSFVSCHSVLPVKGRGGPESGSEVSDSEESDVVLVASESVSAEEYDEDEDEDELEESDSDVDSDSDAEVDSTDRFRFLDVVCISRRGEVCFRRSPLRSGWFSSDTMVLSGGFICSIHTRSPSLTTPRSHSSRSSNPSIDRRSAEGGTVPSKAKVLHRRVLRFAMVNSGDVDDSGREGTGNHALRRGKGGPVLTLMRMSVSRWARYTLF